MSLHAAYARLTPYEIAFPDDAVLDALGAELPIDGGLAFEDFLKSSAAASVVGRLQGADAPSEARYRAAELVYQAVHFHGTGRPLYLVDVPAARSLAEPSDGGIVSRPPSTGYVQLPQHLFWTPAGGAAPESVDGLFWTVSGDALTALVVSGVRPARPGFDAVALPPAPLPHMALWLEGPARPDGRDFRSSLPGGDLDGLYGIETAGEVLALLARFFVLLGSGHGVPMPAPASAQGEGRGPRPSALPYTRVSLGT